MFYNNDEFQMAIEILIEIETEYIGRNSVDDKAFYYNLGFCYITQAINQKSINQVMHYLQKSINYFEKAQNLIGDVIEDIDIDIYRNFIRAYIEYAENKDAKICYEKVIDLTNEIVYKISNNNNYIFQRYDFLLDLALAYENLYDVSPLIESKQHINLATKILEGLYDENDSLPNETAFRLLHNLGRTYFKTAELYTGDHYLDKALEYYNKGLDVPIAHIEANPTFYGQTYLNIGNIYSKKSLFTDENKTELLKNALKNYCIALEVYKNQSHPRELAMTLTNIATTNAQLYKKTNDNKYFLDGVKGYVEALKYRNPIENPVGYAKTQKGLGDLYSIKATAENDLSWINKASDIYNIALTIVTKDKYTKYYCMVRHSQALMLKRQATINNTYENESYQKALLILKEVVILYQAEKNSTIFNVVLEEMMTIMWLIFEKKGDLAEKIDWYKEQLIFLKEIKLEHMAFQIYYNLSLCYLKKYEERPDYNSLEAVKKIIFECKTHATRDHDENQMLDDFLNFITRELQSLQ